MRFRIKLYQYAILIGLTTYVQPSLFAQARTSAPSPQKLSVQVPFVGCKADGQAGPLEAPTGKSKIVAIATELVQRLAYYKAKQGAGVLAPRGWYCFEIYGSNGGALFVSPEPINSEDLFSTSWHGFTGPVIELAGEDGGTSGRFGVAATIARVFPAHRAFVRRVIAEGIVPASDFPFGPYPKDRLIHKSNELVEYQTPAATNGLGTNARLQKNASPISGAAILIGKTPDLLLLSIRLSPDLTDLTPTIIQQVERDVANTR